MPDIYKWLAMDEGCYECGEPSGVIGTFRTQAEAKAACDAAAKRQQAGWKGQHSFVVYDLTEVSSEWAQEVIDG